MTALHLTLTVATYPEGDRWTWTLHSGRHIVSSSGSQLFSRRIDCARGAEVGAGLEGVEAALSKPHGHAPEDCLLPLRRTRRGTRDVNVRILDERGSEPTA